MTGVQPNFSRQFNNYSRRAHVHQPRMRGGGRGGGVGGRGGAQNAEVSRTPPPWARRHGRGQWVNRNSEEQNADQARGYRKTRRPLVPENKAELEKWEPRVMSADEVVDIAKQCIEVVDEFIRLDNYVDLNKRFNSSNHEQLREQRMRQQHMDVQPDAYIELIAQCEANPGKFPGTLFCLKQVLGEHRLTEFIRRRAWTEAQLKEWDTKDWQMFDKKLTVCSDESMSCVLAPPPPPVSYTQFLAATGMSSEEVGSVASAETAVLTGSHDVR